MAVEVTFLSAITGAAAVYFILAHFGMLDWRGWIGMAAVFIIGFLAQWKWYKYLLVDNQ